MSFHTRDFSELIKFQKYPLLITLGFFLITSYVAFFHHNYWTIFDQDGLIYLQIGKDILSGNGKNVFFPSTPPAGSILFALVDSFINDGFITVKLISLLSGTGIVFFSYYILRNIFNSRVALVGQLFFAFNPWIGILSTQALNDLLPICLSIISLYFVTKKNLRLTDVIIASSILGIAFMFRYQVIIFLISIIIFLIFYKKQIHLKITYPVIGIILFLLFSTPMFIYNYSTHGDFIDSDSNYYIGAHSKYYTPEWRNAVFDNIGTNEQAAIFLDFNLFLKNYFYNLLYGQPNNLFGFENRINASLIPGILIIGIIPVMIGTLYLFKINFDKNTLILLLGTIAVTILIIFLIGEITIHFFTIIIFPLIILGLVNIKKIEKKTLLLLILAVTFAVVMAILPLRSPKHFLFMWIVVSATSSVFFVEWIPNIYKKIKNLKSKQNQIFHPSSNIKIFVAILVSLILFINIGYSYIYFGIISSGEPFVSLEDEFEKFYSKDPRNQREIEVEQIADVLSKQSGIENSYIMTTHVLFGYYANSKWVAASFNEGLDNDTIENYITRKNWKDWEILLSNLQSNPADRHNLINPRPDYLIYNPREGHHDYLKVLRNPENLTIPSNFEVIYQSKLGTVVYKIHYSD